MPFFVYVYISTSNTHFILVFLQKKYFKLPYLFDQDVLGHAVGTKLSTFSFNVSYQKVS